MSKFLIALWLGVFGQLALAQADASDELAELLSSLDRLQGDFVQQQYDPDGSLLAEAKGRFRLLRPGYFSWEIVQPDSQLIIADPQYIWHYDRDLETVTRRPVAGSAHVSPLQILGGDETLLRSRFRVEKQEAGRFNLVPVDREPGFSRLSLVFENDQLAAMEIIDGLDQRIVIRFEQLDSSSALSPADFEFVVPETADQFFYEQ